MVIPGDIGSMIDLFSFTAYQTKNQHGNAVKLKKSIRLPISPAITMAML
jgi:hypothetical protein